MSMKNLSLICLVVLVASTSTYGGPIILMDSNNKAATAAGIGVLSETPITKGNIEIRIWRGMMKTPLHMIRLLVKPGGEVSGEVYKHKTKVNLAEEIPSIQEDDYKVFFQWSLLQDFGFCGKISNFERVYVCKANLKSPPDWQVIYDRLKNYRILTLPDQSELPKAEFLAVSDENLVVEARQGSGYRIYEYTSPGIRVEKEARLASQILKEVLDLLEQHVL